MISPQERIIVALDVETLADAAALVRELSGQVGGFKVGLELISRAGAPAVIEAMRGTRLFVDGKFHDIPNTVAAACRAVAGSGVWMLNVHTLGGMAMMQAAKKAAVEAAASARVPVALVIGVTILTSLDQAGLQPCGFPIFTPAELTAQVVRLAQLARSAGLDGVVASPLEIEAIRAACGPDFLIITPGVRPAWAAANDQKRVMKPKEAIAAGADYLVMGRPITQPPKEIGDPVSAVRKIIEEISA